MLRQPRVGPMGQWNSICTSNRTVALRPRASVATSVISALPSLAGSGSTTRSAPTMRAVASDSSDEDASHAMPSGASPAATSESSGRRKASPPASGSGVGAASAWGGRWNSVSVEPGTVSKPRKQGIPPHCAVGIGVASVRSASAAPATDAAANDVPVVSPAETSTVGGVAGSAPAVTATSGAAIANGAPIAALAETVAGPAAHGSASVRTNSTARRKGAPGLPSTETSRNAPRPANRPSGSVSRALPDKSRVRSRGVSESRPAGSAANALPRRSRRTRPSRPSRSFGRRASMPRPPSFSAGTRARSSGLGQWQPCQLRVSSSRTAGVLSQTPS